jgi:hypothetical protein
VADVPCLIVRSTRPLVERLGWSPRSRQQWPKHRWGPSVLPALDFHRLGVGSAAPNARRERAHSRFALRPSPKNRTASGTAHVALSAAPKGRACVLWSDLADCANAQPRSARPYGAKPTALWTIVIPSRPCALPTECLRVHFRSGMITTVAKMESCFRRSGSCFFKPFGATVGRPQPWAGLSRGDASPRRPFGTKLGRSEVYHSGPNFQRVIAAAFLPEAFGRGPL